jgi:mRNA interferase MazF
MAKRTGARPSGAKRGDAPDVPAAGDLIWLSFTPQAGREQAGRRPALVLSPRSYNAKVGLCLVCPVTHQAKGYPFEVPFPDGLPVRGVVLADHIKSADWRERSSEPITTVPPAVIDEVRAKLRPLLGM